jgi:hypothetical protein
VGEVTDFLAGARLDTITLLICIGYAIHKKYLVLGREYERECTRGDKLETALQEATIRELHADETNAKMANLVPDLLKLSIQAKDKADATP